MKTKFKDAITTENICAVLVLVFFIAYPIISSAYQTLNMANFLITVILALSLALIWGYTGIFSYAQAAFYGIGGYTYAILCKNFTDPALTPLFLIGGVVMGFLVALFLGYFMFYGGVNDVFVALVTMCFTLVLETFLAQTAGSEWHIGAAQLGGFNGINAVTPLTIGTFPVKNLALYILALLLVIGIYLAMRIMEKRNLGYCLLSIRENRTRSEMFGYNTAFVQMMIFAVSGAIAGLSGVLYTSWGGYIVPSAVGMTQATMPVVLVAAGGRKNPTAVVIFTLFYLSLSQKLAASGSQYSLVLLGLILLLVVLFVPKGIIHSLFEIIDRKVVLPLKNGKAQAGGAAE
ncbi:MULTISPECIES: ABC transporter permease subunit [Anaerotruncus]|uniref:ABC transporter permease subunit n=1 Tax=Anaerotruncus TaxID=244127 RepID=UPI000835D26D|nr:MULTISPECIES: urea ABC transporter permease [Anaerotruncus]RGX56949.1 urea ABC transporter permease [Anaerotruncus sp. AF02-27]